MTIGDIREMLADLPPSEWERHMAEVAAREDALTADRDGWRRRARVNASRAWQWRKSQRSMAAVWLGRKEGDDGYSVEARRGRGSL